MRQFKKLLLMNVFIISSIVIATLLIVSQVTNQQRQTALHSGGQIAKRYAQKISTFLEKNNTLVHGFATFMKHHHSDSREKINNIIEELLRENIHLSAVFCCFEFSKEDKPTTYYWNRLADNNIKLDKPNDIHKSDWYRKSKITKKFQMAYSVVQRNASLVSLIVPMVKDDNFIGIIGIDISFDLLANVVEEANEYDAGYTFLVDNKNRYIVHPNANLVEQSQTIASYAKQNKRPSLEKIIKEANGNVKLVDPETNLLTYMFYESLNSWKIVVAISENEMLISEKNTNFSAAAICFGLCILVIIITYIFAAESTVSLYHVNETVTRLSQGDLKSKIPISTKGEVGKLGNTINKFVDNLYNFAEKSDLICNNLQKSVQKAHIEGENIFTHAEKEATTVNQFRQKISTTSKMLDEATATTQKVETQVQSIKKTMDELSQTSNKMSEVLKIIDDIAFETNLLAINAAIESAHVGDVGKGFEVVADEMRLLSKRTEMQSNEVSKSIHDNIQQIHQGVEAITSVIENITEIASSSKELAQTIKQISTTVVEMDAFTQHNLSVISELKITSNKINNDAQALASLIQFFQIK
ncbi:methyl-accepting chemotaxis protein [Candidatus Uabimicrobium sp. HlEnr_7]|uniref:methyl-accepting chemotaxis protein n=1 Tax=Candidatus Uabimicrobium helgolandensis TaxID=3095367 RepID=UPI0035560B66